MRGHITQMLDRRSRSLKDIVKTLQVYHDNVEDEQATTEDGAPSQKEILKGLITFLESC
jgi:beta-catenin-like protein 1